VQPIPAIARHIPVTKTSSTVLKRTSEDTESICNAAVFDSTYARPW